MYSSEIESWFEKVDVAPVVQNEAYSLEAASKKGLLPVKGIEEHPRTVENVVYQSESESEQSSVFDSSMDITINTEPTPHRVKSTPVHQNTAHTLLPHNRQPLSPLYWNHPHDDLIRLRMMSDSMLPRVVPAPPKNIAQSSMPCVWSYSTQPNSGIAPHFSSNFFHRLRLRRHSNKKTGGSKHGADMYPPRKKFPSLPQPQEQLKESNLEEEFGRRHSLYDQFVLHRDPRLDEKKIPVRRASMKVQGLYQACSARLL